MTNLSGVCLHMCKHVTVVFRGVKVYLKTLAGNREWNRLVTPSTVCRVAVYILV
ncbi:hypothetical protein BS17DRAFT_776677 [Gyrodon lividus]|nr:hypothetical protein BS17DRAFT_776669 [Gyrodon lividus]KAF9226112.1 hypothetical protein BS17DRAFT_776677 [Gyrodon lividus]